MDNQQNPHQLLELEPIDMHGPVEVKLTVRLMLPDARIAGLTFKAEAGHLPTRAELKSMLDSALNIEGAEQFGIPPGTRLLTKPEFVEFVTLREAGQSMSLPGNQEFVPSTCDIPHEMLVHAILGSDCVPEDLPEEGYAHCEQLGVISTPIHWDRDKLAALPDDELLAIYRRITT